MKRYLIALSLLIAVRAPTVHAIQWVRAKDYMLPSDEKAPGELWVLANQQAILDGHAADDLFLLAQTADLNGVFDGDVWAIASQIKFSGTARDQVRLGGQTVWVGGQIHRTLLVAASTVTVERDAQVDGDVILIANEAIFKGCASNLYIIATKATISGTVRGKVRLASDDIVILSGTEVFGDIVYTSSQDLALDSRVIVHGVLRRTRVFPGGFEPRKADWRSTLNLHFYRYAAALFVGLAIASLFPGLTGAAVRALRSRAGWCGLAGFIAMAAIPMIIVALFLLLIGVPLGMVLLASYLLLFYLAKIPVALLLGSVVLRARGPTPFRTVFSVLSIGLFVLYALGAVPYIGVAMVGIATIFGFGALITAMFTQDRALLRGIAQPPPLETSLSGIAADTRDTNTKET